MNEAPTAAKPSGRASNGVDIGSDRFCWRLIRSLLQGLFTFHVLEPDLKAYILASCLTASWMLAMVTKATIVSATFRNPWPDGGCVRTRRRFVRLPSDVATRRSLAYRRCA